MRNCREHGAVVERSVGKLVGNISSHFVVLVRSISRAIPNQGFRAISELDNFSENLHGNWTGHFEPGFTCDDAIGGVDRVVLRHRFSLIGAHT